MSDVNCEKLIRLADVPTLPWMPDGKPHLSTVYRWVTRGVRGRRLRTARVGNSVVTSERWVMEFAGLLDAPTAPVPTTRQRQRAVSQAERELAEAGI